MVPLGARTAGGLFLAMNEKTRGNFFTTSCFILTSHYFPFDQHIVYSNLCTMSTTPPLKRRKLSPPPSDETAPANPDSSTPPTSSPSTLPTDRASRFAALKSRAVASSRANLAETAAEAKRASINPTALSNLSRKAAVAQHNLLKADTEEEGGKGAFERKRAWDYTIEESEKWDERIGKKRDARDKNSFQDYGSEAGKIYERQIAQMEKAARGKDGGGGNLNREDYERQKGELIEKAARSGGLEVVELDSGETVAIDSNGTFYADVESVGFAEQKPKRENVDRLVADLRKAEDVRLKKRKERRGADAVEEGDVTYINDKNKQFNMKLGRFYDRYTKDIKESFERGTAM
jgi:pre-mRNA-splicing factor SYF2